MADRNPAKRKRAAQNKAARDALAARRAKAAAEPPAAAPSGGSGRRGTGRAASGGAARGTGRPSRTGPARPVREPTSAIGRFLASVQAEPGGKAVMFGFLFSVVAAVMILFFPVTPRAVLDGADQVIAQVRKANGLAVPKAYDPDQVVVQSTYAFRVLGPIAVGVALLPVIVAGAALAAVRAPNRRRNVTVCTFVMGLLVLVLGQLGLFFFFSLGALIYGTYQIRKAEGPVAPRAPRARRGARDADEDADVDDPADDDEA